MRSWLIASLALASIMTILAMFGVFGFWYTGSLLSAFIVYWIISLLGTVWLTG